MITVYRASDTDISAYTGKPIIIPTIGWVGLSGGEYAGAGGLSWTGGRCWLWLELAEGSRPPAVLLWRMTGQMKTYAAALGERVLWAVRDARFDTSERLLRRLGFERTEEMFDGSEVWKCPVLN